ncbi:MAG: TIGR01906 family membrane protein [Sarcina sp.]
MIKKIFTLFLSLFIFIFLIFINSLLVLNSTFIFKIYTYLNGTGAAVNLTPKEIFFDYSAIINYLQNPFSKELSFENFTISNFGQIHFFEVKRIFFFITVFIVIFSLILIYIYIKKRDFLKSSISKINYVSIFILSTLLIAFAVDFNWVFTLFHKILFNNDYWIFNSVTDSIINVLPESFFMINAIIILFILFLELFALNKIKKRI